MFFSGGIFTAGLLTSIFVTVDMCKLHDIFVNNFTTLTHPTQPLLVIREFQQMVSD